MTCIARKLLSVFFYHYYFWIFHFWIFNNIYDLWYLQHMVVYRAPKDLTLKYIPLMSVRTANVWNCYLTVTTLSSTFPIVVIFFRGCVSEMVWSWNNGVRCMSLHILMVVLSYSVIYYIYFPGTLGPWFHYWCSVYGIYKWLDALWLVEWSDTKSQDIQATPRSSRWRGSHTHSWASSSVVYSSPEIWKYTESGDVFLYL